MGFQVEELAESLVTLPALERDSRDWLFLRRNREETHTTVLLILRFFYHGDFHGNGNFDFSLTSSRHNPNCRYARQT